MNPPTTLRRCDLCGDTMRPLDTVALDFGYRTSYLCDGCGVASMHDTDEDWT